MENTGDRPVQVGSHFHFAETNPALRLDPAAAKAEASHRRRHQRPLRARHRPRRRASALCRGSLCRWLQGRGKGPVDGELTRPRYAALYGPTAGDRVRLADTDLFIEVTEDLCGGPGKAGDEVVFGGRKVVRESIGQGRATRAEEPDLVITGAIILDYSGVFKAESGSVTAYRRHR